MLKSLAKCTFAIMLILFSISLVVYMKYDISVTEYLADSVPLTRQEQQYLKEKNVYPQLIAEHEEIIEKIENREKEEAVRIVCRHIGNQVTAVTGTIRMKQN